MLLTNLATTIPIFIQLLELLKSYETLNLKMSQNLHANMEGFAEPVTYS